MFGELNKRVKHVVEKVCLGILNRE